MTKKAIDYDRLFAEYCEQVTFYVDAKPALYHYDCKVDKREALRKALKKDSIWDMLWASCFGVWPGARAMSGHIIDRPEKFNGKKVYDLGAGSGVIGILAAQAAAEVTAIDTDPLAIETIRRNAQLNNVAINVIEGNLYEPKLSKDADILIALDIEFFRDGSKMFQALTRLAQGKELYVATTANEHDLKQHPLNFIETDYTRFYNKSALAGSELMLGYYDGRPTCHLPKRKRGKSLADRRL